MYTPLSLLTGKFSQYGTTHFYILHHYHRTTTTHHHPKNCFKRVKRRGRYKIILQNTWLDQNVISPPRSNQKCNLSDIRATSMVLQLSFLILSNQKTLSIDRRHVNRPRTGWRFQAFSYGNLINYRYRKLSRWQRKRGKYNTVWSLCSLWGLFLMKIQICQLYVKSEYDNKLYECHVSSTPAGLVCTKSVSICFCWEVVPIQFF